MVEQSANDMNEIKAQLKDVDAGHQTLVQKVSGMENGVADRLDDLAKADASLLAKLSALESTNDQTVRAATADLEKKIHDAEHKLDQSSKAEIQSVCQHLEQQMQTNNSNTERRLAEADAGNQQLLEKLLEVEKDVEGKVRDNASSVQNQLTNLDADNKNNAQMLVTLRESINIQVQETKKVDAERQRSEAKAKEDLDANAAANARAIADLKDQLGETIAQRVKPTEDRLSEVNGDLKAMHGTLEQFEDAIDKRINTDVMLRIENLKKDNQKALGDLETQIGESISQRMKPSEDKLSKVDGEISGLHKTVAVFESRHVETTKSLKEVTVLTERIQTQVNDQGQKMAEQSANDLNRINDRLQDMENQAGLSDQKIKELDAGNQNLLEKVLGMDGNLSERLDKQEQMDNTLMNRINELHSNNSESVSSIQLRLGDLDKESKDNITQIVNLQDTINIQAEQVNAVDADRQKAAGKTKADLESTVASKAKAIADLKNELGQSIVDKFRPAEDRLANIDGDIQGLNKTVAVFEQKHTETAEKIQEVTVLTSNIQVQVKAQEQKMVEQSANDMNEIKAQLKDVDAGHQTLVQKVSGMENGVADRLDDLAKADASLLAKLSALESTNDQTVRAATADLEKKIHDAEHKLDQSSKAEIQSVCQHLEQQMQTNNSNTERRLAEADAGNQQLLEKLLEVEKDVEGKVRDNASSVQNQLTNLDADNKNNAQMLVTLRESINIQVQETKKVDAERQRSEAKAKEDLDANAAANARAIADLKDQLGETIAQRVKPTEDRLSEVNGDLKAMHGTLEQFEDAIDKRINTDVMLRIENLKKDNQKALGDLETQIGESISQRMKPSEDKLSKVDGEISGLHKTVAVFESRHVETTKSLKEVTVLTERIQTQVNDQGQKMAEQSANDLNRINDRLQDMENQAGLSDQKIKELDAGNQNLLEKVLGMDGNLSERLDKQEQMDNTLMNRINELHSNNSESVSSIQLRLGDLDKESKDNITQIVNLQDTINIQAEQVNAVDADRQKAAGKTKADLESTVASKAKAIADLKNELGQSIVDKFRPVEDRPVNIDDNIQGLNKTFLLGLRESVLS